MRFFKRFLLFWLLMLPVSYFFLLPLLQTKLSERTRADTLTECGRQLTTAGFNAEAGAPYCQCLTEGLTLTRDDLFDLVKRRPPVQFTAWMTAKTETCQHHLAGLQAPTSGAEVIHFE